MELLDELGVTGVPAITALCYLGGEVLKLLPVQKKWIPVFCSCLGCVLGAAAMFLIPDYPGGNLLSALAVGAVSGFASTGIHHAYKGIKAPGSQKNTS